MVSKTYEAILTVKSIYRLRLITICSRVSRQDTNVSKCQMSRRVLPDFQRWRSLTCVGKWRRAHRLPRPLRNRSWTTTIRSSVPILIMADLRGLTRISIIVWPESWDKYIPQWAVDLVIIVVDRLWPVWCPCLSTSSTVAHASTGFDSSL